MANMHIKQSQNLFLGKYKLQLKGDTWGWGGELDEGSQTVQTSL